ncbi:WbqC family protein [Methanococcoides sp. SA1]|nr:WbqC family protein [Methanococcoides sp. SA1]
MTTVLTAHQPLYIPWLGFFQKVSMSDKFCLWDDVQFDPNDYQNRNRLKNPNGECMITVPIKTKGYREKTIGDMQIENQHNWQRIHLNTINISYAKAPYFESYSDFFKKTFERKWDKLVDLDEHILEYLFKELGMNVDIIRSSDLKLEGAKSSRIIDMCNKLEADIYIFGTLGKEYADLDKFKQANITPYFQEYKHPSYSQLWKDYTPNLSVLDLLFNYGENSYGILTANNPTREDVIKFAGGV